MNADKKSRVWAIVPAGGVGKRMAANRPKQYLEVGGVPVLHHTLRRLCRCAAIDSVIVGIAPGDAYWNQCIFEHEKLSSTFAAGEERAKTVLNGLNVLLGQQGANESDWVLIHDAVRPCIFNRDIEAVIAGARESGIGAVLGMPVTDTLKLSDTWSTIQSTVDRSGMWRALTPQVFPLEQLRTAIQDALTDGCTVTDESSAMEHAGVYARLVEGHPGNIKLTTKQDIPLLQQFLMEYPE